MLRGGLRRPCVRARPSPVSPQRAEASAAAPAGPGRGKWGGTGQPHPPGSRPRPPPGPRPLQAHLLSGLDSPTNEPSPPSRSPPPTRPPGPANQASPGPGTRRPCPKDQARDPNPARPTSRPGHPPRTPPPAQAPPPTRPPRTRLPSSETSPPLTASPPPIASSTHLRPPSQPTSLIRSPSPAQNWSPHAGSSPRGPPAPPYPGLPPRQPPSTPSLGTSPARAPGPPTPKPPPREPPASPSPGSPSPLDPLPTPGRPLTPGRGARPCPPGDSTGEGRPGLRSPWQRQRDAGRTHCACPQPAAARLGVRGARGWRLSCSAGPRPRLAERDPNAAESPRKAAPGRPVTPCPWSNVHLRRAAARPQARLGSHVPELRTRSFPAHGPRVTSGCYPIVNLVGGAERAPALSIGASSVWETGRWGTRTYRCGGQAGDP